MQMLPLKFAEAFQLMVAFISTHPNSFGVNSLSIFLAVVKRLTHTSSTSVAAISTFTASLTESVMLDCQKIDEVLQELNELGSASEEELTAS